MPSYTYITQSNVVFIILWLTFWFSNKVYLKVWAQSNISFKWEYLFCINVLSNIINGWFVIIRSIRLIPDLELYLFWRIKWISILEPWFEHCNHNRCKYSFWVKVFHGLRCYLVDQVFLTLWRIGSGWTPKEIKTLPIKGPINWLIIVLTRSSNSFYFQMFLPFWGFFVEFFH